MGRQRRTEGRGRWWTLTAALTVLALVAAACGDSDDPDGEVADAPDETAPEEAPDEPEDDDGDAEEPPADEPITLRVAWWGADARHNATIEAIELFEEQYPNVTVDPEFSGFDGYNDRLATQAAGGNAPDVFQVDPSAVKGYADAGVMVNLDDYAGSVLRLDGLGENVRDLGRTDEGLFSLPWGLTAPILMARPDLLHGTDMPADDWSWERYAEWAAEVHEASDGAVHGTQDLGYMDDALRVWLRQRGLSLYTEDGGLDFDVDDLAEYFIMWDGLREQGAAVDAETSAQWDGTPQNMALTMGRSAAEFGYTSVLRGVADTAAATVEAVRLPGNSDTPGDYLRPSVFLSAYSGSDNIEMAVQFIDFMINDVDAGLALGATRGVPPNEDIQQAIRSEVDEETITELDYIAGVADRVGPPPPLAPAGAFEIISLLRRVYEEVSFGSATPEQAAEQFFAEAPGILGD